MKHHLKMILAIIITAVVTFAVMSFFRGGDMGGSKEVSSSQKADSPSSQTADHQGPGRISGAVKFNALKPEPGDEGEIIFQVREYGGSEDFSQATMVTTPSFDNGGTWMIDELKEGVGYDVQATIIINGKKIVSSPVATVTAPATDVDLTLTVTWKDLPEQSIKASKNKTISGTLEISGHIPKGATYSLFTAPQRDLSDLSAEEVDDPVFTKVVSGAKADNDNEWKWDEALAQAEYRIRAELYTAKGEYIGTSNIIDAVVPQNDVELELQSKAVVEPVKTPISGTVKLNGGYKSDSEIVVQVREDGANGYTNVDRFPAESDRAWVYKDAKTGITYDVRAVLQRNGEEQSKSSQKDTTAPAKSIKLTINTSLDMDEPDDKPEVVDCDKKDNGKYEVKLRFPGVDSARAYWIRVGKNKHGGDIFNEKENVGEHGDDETIKLRIEKEKYYYAEYAYSFCKDCETMDSYSDFSDELKFYCGDKP